MLARYASSSDDDGDERDSGKASMLGQTSASSSAFATAVGVSSQGPLLNANLAVAASASSLALVAASSRPTEGSSESNTDAGRKATANAQYAVSGSGIQAPEVPPPPPRLAAHQRSHARQVAMVSTYGFKEAMHQNNYNNPSSTILRTLAPIGPPRSHIGEPKRKRRKGRRRSDINSSTAASSDVGNELMNGPWAPVAEQAKVPEPDYLDHIESAANAQPSPSGLSSSSKPQSSATDPHDGDGRTKAERTALRLARVTSSVFHGASERDYQGRPWCARPRGINPDEEHDCFVPKKVIRTLDSHEKGVWDVALAPKYGHILLSASTDKTVKAWNFRTDPEDYTNMRTYYGHKEAVKSVRYSGDGASFVTASFDRTIKVWDIETGTCTGSFSNGSIPSQALFSEREPTVVLSACKNRCVMQYDLRSGEMVQEYNYHLDAVNSVTFYDEGNRFMSTSDDKKILLWDYNTPTPHKYIAEPHMHSMPTATLSPDSAHIAGQCMDNTIRVYSTQGRFSLAKNKEFKGHIVSGYACQVAFSPNGRFLASGDEAGQLWFWDWLRCRRIKALRGHSNGPCIALKWHPLRPSCLVSCGWDGKIKIWD